MIEHNPRRGRRLNLNENGNDDIGGEVVGVQHARRASEKEKRNDKRMVEMVNENEEERNDGKEYMRAFLAYPCQDKVKGLLQGLLGENSQINTI